MYVSSFNASLVTVLKRKTNSKIRTAAMLFTQKNCTCFNHLLLPIIIAPRIKRPQRRSDISSSRVLMKYDAGVVQMTQYPYQVSRNQLFQRLENTHTKTSLHSYKAICFLKKINSTKSAISSRELCRNMQ
jgi:hypothetical protein